MLITKKLIINVNIIIIGTENTGLNVIVLSPILNKVSITYGCIKYIPKVQDDKYIIIFLVLGLNFKLFIFS